MNNAIHPLSQFNTTSSPHADLIPRASDSMGDKVEAAVELSDLAGLTKRHVHHETEDQPPPTSSLPPPSSTMRKPRKATPWNLAECVYIWGIWFFLSVLVFSQFLGIIWNSVTSHQYMIYGQSPLKGTFSIPGQNDEPYSDRNVVCMLEGRNYIPMQLSKVLQDSHLSTTIDTTGTKVNGYRVVKRNQIDLDPGTFDHYVHVCDMLAATIVAIQDSCDALGYNVTRDSLRIVDDTFSTTMLEIPRALPILVMPFWDNAIFAHYAIPGWDGSSCVMRLIGKYEQTDKPNAVIRSVSRSVREAKTIEWLGKPGGVWRNGWYEDPSGQRWYSDLQSTNTEDEYGMLVRQFDGLKNVEYDCSGPKPPVACLGIPATEWWGSKFSVTEDVQWYNAVAISNGTRYGLFIYEALQSRVVKCQYTLEMFISNVSLGLILVRWLVSMMAQLNSYRLGITDWQNASIGCLACARSFNVLPVMLMPRLKFTLAALWTVGCEFEGQQKALSEAWFAIYPGIAEFMLFYYSVLNFLAKVTHRRMSDVLFGPTLIFFCLMHRFRLDLAQSGWFEFDGRISTVILSNEVDALKVTDFFTTDAALRMNGNIRYMYTIKIIVLVINALPLLFSDNMTFKGKKFTSCAPCEVEKSLAIRAANVGGLGRSRIYDWDEGVDIQAAKRMNKVTNDDALREPVMVQSTEVGEQSAGFAGMLRYLPDRFQTKTTSGRTTVARTDHVLITYEVTRLGYVVFGGKFLISFDDWYILASMAPMRIIEKLWNHRVIVFDVIKKEDGYYVSRTAQLCRLDDERLLSIPFYDVTVCPFR